ncbi:zf-TFIIB domain-containing protein [Mycobacterium sp.]|uniref:TFIIB-type zinc ribbon-containing protein n=1 Tax=Mycobacterium sp. TaxID=1785 RepID=UPI0025F4019E|nr:zf-TFIIB domain-containing protein [Mycobacterium sp.]
MVDTALTCPRCSGTMITYERSDIEIDQCQNCRGVFLDRGELEKLMEAEQRHYQQPAPQPAPGYPQQGYPPQGYPPQQGYPTTGYSEHHGYYDHDHDEDYGHHGYRRRGFMHGLFD